METTHTTTHTYAEKLATNRLGLWLFFVSDAFVFGALLVTRYYLLGGRRPHLEQGLGLLVPSVLLVSSFFMNRARSTDFSRQSKGFCQQYADYHAVGIVFLVGVIGFEWRCALWPGGWPEGAVFYMMTGMHAFHVLTGVIFLFIIYRNGRNGKFSARNIGA
jgi:cytochrome c oxidase subunit 3